MSHIPTQETVYGKNVEWMEPVTESQHEREQLTRLVWKDL